jgi:phosphoribosylglycinamide formyltransferase-1
MINLAIFISGNGSNAQAIHGYFAAHDNIAVRLLVTNNAASIALPWFQEMKVETLVIQNEDLLKETEILQALKKAGVDLIILAGFLRKIPDYLIRAFPNRILNIHPSLLPKFGGKGMYGIKVHQAVLNAGEKETGITIHLVNEHYDEGQILAQYSLVIPDNCNDRYLQTLVQELEHKHYPLEIEKYINNV